MTHPCYVCGEQVYDELFVNSDKIECGECGNVVHDKAGCREPKDGRILCGICAAK